MIRRHLLNIKPSATLAINEKSAQLQSEGQEIFRLGFGQSPFPVPQSVVETLKEHAPVKDYLPVKGLYALREAISYWINLRTGNDYTADNVMVSPGSKELLFLTQTAFDGDLMLLSPSWVSYQPQGMINLKKVITIPSYEEGGYLLQPELLEKACQNHSGSGKMLLLNYPGNPSGTTYNEDQLGKLAEVARKYGVFILSDEIYGELHFKGQHISIATFYPEGTIISTGLSKWCGAGGWRLGAFVFPDSLKELMNVMAMIASETYTSASAPIQYAAISAYKGRGDIEEYIRSSRCILKNIGNYVCNRLQALKISCPNPDGGFYLFINFENYRSRLESIGIFTSEDLCTTLLEQVGIALLPGSDFGRKQEELTARLSFVDFDGEKALDFISEQPAFNDKWMIEIAPRIVKAMEVLKRWISSLNTTLNK